MVRCAQQLTRGRHWGSAGQYSHSCHKYEQFGSIRCVQRMPVWVCSSLVSSVIQNSRVCMALCGEHVCTVGRLCMGPGGDACLSQGGDRGDSRQGGVQSPHGPAGFFYACRRCVTISRSHWCISMCPSGGTLEETGLVIGMCDGYWHVCICVTCVR